MANDQHPTRPHRIVELTPIGWGAVGCLSLLVLILIIGTITATLAPKPGPTMAPPPSSPTPAPPAPTPKEPIRDTWAGRDDEVVRILKSAKIPGTKGNVLQLTSGYLELLKRSGNFIEFEGWYAFQVSGPLYEAGVGFKVNGGSKTARWDVDLQRRTIKPRNQEAFIFSGNNDVLRY